MSKILKGKQYKQMLSCIKEHAKSNTILQFLTNEEIIDRYTQELFELVFKEGFIIKPHFKTRFSKDIALVLNIV